MGLIRWWQARIGGTAAVKPVTVADAPSPGEWQAMARTMLARAEAAEAQVKAAEDHARLLLDVVDRLTRRPEPVPERAGAVSEPLPDVVEQAIASRSGRGNVNRASQLRASARLLLKETQGNAAEVADLILTGSGDLDL